MNSCRRGLTVTPTPLPSVLPLSNLHLVSDTSPVLEIKAAKQIVPSVSLLLVDDLPLPSHINTQKGSAASPRHRLPHISLLDCESVCGWVRRSTWNQICTFVKFVLHNHSPSSLLYPILLLVIFLVSFEIGPGVFTARPFFSAGSRAFIANAHGCFRCVKRRSRYRCGSISISGVASIPSIHLIS